MNGSESRLVSYAQNREDLYLWALLGHRDPGTYVDVGCNHERLHSVTKLFYERGWSGLDIDANDEFRSEYAGRDRDRFITTGVSSAPGELVFRRYPCHDGLSTFDQGIKDLHTSSAYPFEDVTLPVRTLDEILDDADISSPDFVKIDVEGMEPDVLRGLDLDRRRPAVIVTEASRQADCDQILLPRRYHVEFFDGLNVYYADDEAADVSIHNFAGRVLKVGYATDREVQLESALAHALSTVERMTKREATEARELRVRTRDAVRRLIGRRR